jgi:hypothetical protein
MVMSRTIVLRSSAVVAFAAILFLCLLTSKSRRVPVVRHPIPEDPMSAPPPAAERVPGERAPAALEKSPAPPRAWNPPHVRTPEELSRYPGPRPNLPGGRGGSGVGVPLVDQERLRHMIEENDPDAGAAGGSERSAP